MLDPGDYTVGWICALSTEYLAAQEFLDEEHGRPGWRSPKDSNEYFLGAIGRHNVAIAVLPMGEYGTASAADVAINMLRTFPNIKIGLMVGIGGGAPSLPGRDIRLGDAVISCPENSHSGVFQYDFGKSIQERAFQYTQSLDRPPQALLTALAGLRTQHKRRGNGLSEAVAKILNKKPRLRREYGRPSPDTDILFDSNFVHVGDACVETCNNHSMNKIQRPRREPGLDDDPAVHYGAIASGNTLMKDAVARDLLAAEKNVLCFEMEAAGLVNRFPCLVIRGICDYSDSHKSQDWQGYASMVAAAYAKDLIGFLVPDLVQSEQKLSSILSDVLETVTDTHCIVQGMESRQHAHDKKGILSWLTNTSFGAQQSDLLAKHQPGTCQWFLDSYKYRSWVGKSNQTLFCPGIPGAGKTILSSVVVHDLETRFTNSPKIALSYFYCSFKNQQYQNVRMLLASVLKQLCQQWPTVPDAVTSLHDKHEKRQSNASVGEITEALQSVASKFSQVLLVVDALDEWQEMESDRTLMIRALLDLQAKTRINILVTSRPIEDIKKLFRRCSSITISASKADIALYIDGRKNRLPKFVTETAGLLGEIQKTLSEVSQDMFLIPQLYLEWLRTEISVRDLEATLAQLANQSEKNDLGHILCKAYDETMERVFAQNPRHRELACRVLSWVAFAHDKLTTLQIKHALALRDSDTALDVNGMHDAQLMVSVCCGLVTIDKAGDEFRLVHYTTQEYFKNNQSRWFPDVHQYLAKQCLSYLSLRNFEYSDGSGTFENRRSRESQYPFHSYAAQNWGHHARSIPEEFYGNIDEITLRFLDSESCFDAAAEAATNRTLNESHNSMNGLHLAAHFGLERLFDVLVRRHAVTSKDNMGRTALSYACNGGHKAAAEYLILRLLICEGGTLNEQHSTTGQTPLHLAASQGHAEIARLLLKYGANAQLKNACDGTPTLEAVRRGHHAVLELLLNALGSRTDQVSHAIEQDLHIQAVKRDNLAALQLLLDRGLGIDTWGKTGRSCLMEAIKLDMNAVAQWVLDRGADPNSRSKWGLTALMDSRLSNFNTASLLLERGADPNLQGGLDSTTALIVASQKGRNAIVKLLLGHGAEPNTADNLGERALLAACRLNFNEYGYTELVKMLLDSGASVHVQNKHGWTPLMGAINYRRYAAVELILERHPALDLQNEEGLTALMMSVIRRESAISHLLINRGAAVDFQGKTRQTFGRTALMDAIISGDETTSEMIIKRSNALNVKDRDGMTALDYAFVKSYNMTVEGRKVIKQLLLERGAKANVYKQFFTRAGLLI